MRLQSWRSNFGLLEHGTRKHASAAPATRRCIVTFEDDISWGLRSLASEAPSVVDVFAGVFATPSRSPQRSTKMRLLHSLPSEFGSGLATPVALVDYSCQDRRTTTAWGAQRYSLAVTITMPEQGSSFAYVFCASIIHRTPTLSSRAGRGEVVLEESLSTEGLGIEMT